MSNEEREKQLHRGQLSILDKLAWGEEDIGPSISTYLDTVYSNRQSRRWARATNWAENMLFGLGHHYISQILMNRLNRDSNNNLSVSDDVVRSIPKPVNDLLGRFIETNVALLTENRPVPRVTAISDNIRDTKAAELSELTINYLWEELGLPEKHRELARHIMYTGIGFLETCYDPLMPRYMPVPDMREEPNTPLSSGMMVPVPRQVQVIDEKTGELKYKEEIQYGDITANVVSGFEMHFPLDHYWNSDEMGWVLREKYIPLEVVKDKYTNPKVKNIANRKNGYFVDDIDKVSNTNLHTMPLWWWERLTDIVEGPSPTLFAATPEIWEGYTVMRVFDRKPNATWPQGRTIITVGDKLIYDSPKNVGARAFSTRWPKRWHPYTRYHWESVPGSIYGRSMVGKLLPCIKRINSIDTVLIMWRRTVPIATWLAPKGCVFADTLINNSDGTVSQIIDITKGKIVHSFNDSGKVLSTFEYDSEGENCVELRVKGQLPIRITKNHKLPVIQTANKPFKRIWDANNSYSSNYAAITEQDIVERTIGELKVGDHVLSCFNRNRNGDTKLDLGKYFDFNTKNRPCKAVPKVISIDGDFLRLAGLYLAEGSLVLKKGSPRTIKWTIGVHEKDSLGVEIQNLVRSIFGLETICEIEKNPYGQAYQIRLHSRPVASLFEALFSHLAKNKKISSEIFFAPVSLLPLVGGWIDGDGSSRNAQPAKDGRIRTWKTSNSYTTSINLAFQMKNILLDEMIATGIYKETKSRINPKYNLTWSTTNRRLLAPYSNKFKTDTAQKTSEQGFWLGRYRVERVKSIKPIEYTGKVYDIEVEGDHHYHANGVIIHNSQPVEDFFKGGEAGNIWEYDPRRTNNQAPTPVYPPPFPETALRERDMMLAQMEAISGTEQILKGERPVGATSATMLEALRKQALASRSATLQSWDESLQEVGTSLLQETIKHIKDDPVYKQRLSILAREKTSKFQIDEFSGENLSDNVQVRIDTASEAMISREAKQQRALELIQYGPNLAQIEPGLRARLVSDLGWPDAMVPGGPDITRGRNLVHWLKTKKFNLCVPLPEDDPYVIHEILVNETKEASFMDLENEVQLAFFKIIELYKDSIEQIENSRMQLQQQMMGAQGAAPKK